MDGGANARLQSVRRVPRKAGGFTIVEVLIVLAVTGAMFLSMVLLINGKQQVTAFNQATRAVQTEVQQVMNDVGSGYYPNNNDISCTAGGPGGGPKLTTGAAEQGTNVDCVFLGKVIQFAADNGGSNDPQEFNVYSIVGLRGDSISPSVDLKSAKARLIASGNGFGESGVPNEFDTHRLEYGLAVSKMYYDGNPSKTLRAVGFSSNLNSLGAADGSQHVNIVAIPDAVPPVLQDKSTAVSHINGVLGTIDASQAGNLLNPDGGVAVCFDSGGTDQSALLLIGAAHHENSAELQIFNGKGCV